MKSMAEKNEHPPHYLRFARVLAFVSMVGSSAGCQALPPSVACAHCRCGSDPFSLSRPLTCDVIGHAVCCVAIRVPGPLAPPDLPS